MKNKFARHSVNQKIFFALIAFMIFANIEGCGTSLKAAKTPPTDSVPKKVPIDSTHRPATPVDSIKMNR